MGFMIAYGCAATIVAGVHFLNKNMGGSPTLETWQVGPNFRVSCSPLLPCVESVPSHEEQAENCLVQHVENMVACSKNEKPTSLFGGLLFVFNSVGTFSRSVPVFLPPDRYNLHHFNLPVGVSSIGLPSLCSIYFLPADFNVALGK